MAQFLGENDDLQQYLLSDVTPTGRLLGTGSYGSVEEVLYQNVVCAGKKLHEALVEEGNEGTSEIVQKYHLECRLMSNLHHPNITQFLGVCFFPESHLPVLVMERLECSLDSLLEEVQNIPFTLKHSMLEDVAKGLHYLHSRHPPVIHRDLTARNVLLTTAHVAKISDLGNSRIVDLGVDQQRTLTRLPGTLVYMPPEALDSTHRYGPSLDIFSYGNVVLFTLTQKFPGNLLPSTYFDQNNPELIKARTELQRREEYVCHLTSLERLGLLPSLLIHLVSECLRNIPSQRPSAESILVTLQAIREEREMEFNSYLVALDMAKLKMMKCMKFQEEKMDQLVRRHNSEKEEVKKTLEVKDVIIEQLHAQIRSKDEESNASPAGDRPAERLSLKLKPHSWRQGQDMPFKMSCYLQSATINKEVYVGGGITTDYHDENNYIVLKYNISSKSWTKLPRYGTCDFAMVSVNSQLVLFGGNTNSVASKIVGAWDVETQSWLSPYPEMPTARSRCSATAYQEWCIVAGGWVTDGSTSSSVEVLNIVTKQWHVGPCTPIAWTAMKATIADKMCYFMGGLTEKDYMYTSEVYGLSLPALLNYLSTGTVGNNLWKELTPLTTIMSAPLSIDSSLLAVGGSTDGKASKLIQLYRLESEEWVVIGSLPVLGRYGCSSTSLGKEIIVVGGYCNCHLNRTDIGLII